MRQILVYADSLSWGIIPNTRKRLPFEQRWPGVLEGNLNQSGANIRVIEDCLNGRRSNLEDPIKPGRNGAEGLAQRIEINSPLALVILMLGSNDFQNMHNRSVNDTGTAIKGLINIIRQAPIEPGMPSPEILVVAPPVLQTAKGAIAAKFTDCEYRSKGLEQAIRQAAEATACHFFAASTVTTTSKVDGVHLDTDQHQTLGLALSPLVSEILST